jgi:hypothetical protein
MTVGVLRTSIHNTLQIGVNVFFLCNSTTLQLRRVFGPKRDEVTGGLEKAA